jgi:NAD(P)-dependent dehydrogenase (short-subunit alcohol dehydrogenase family)
MGALYSLLIYKPAYPTQSFAGRTIIVTGSNGGIGLEAARHFVRLGAAKVILAVRNLPGGKEAAADIVRTTKRSDVVEVWKLDLARYTSVKDFADRAQRELPRLDVLALNASMATGIYETAEGLETTITVNTVSNFLLLVAMLPLMRKTATSMTAGEERPHIAVVGSGIHHWLDLPSEKFADGEILRTLSKRDGFPNAINAVPANYINSKLLQALLVREIAPLIDPDEVILNHDCPGLVRSKLRRELVGIVPWLLDLIARTPEVGARSVLMGAVVGKESHGKALSDAKIQEGFSGQADHGYSKWVLSKEGEVMGRRVWKEVKEIIEAQGVDVEAALSSAR